MLDIVIILANILLGMSVVGTAACIMLFLAAKIFKFHFIEKIIAKLCILFAITWFVNIGCNILILILTPKTGLSAVVSSPVKNISPGQIMLSKDQAIPKKDYEVSLSTTDTTMEIALWDYAEEDGDSIQISFNGQPVSNSFQLKNSPKTFSIPTKGKLEIKATKDGSNGITYALYISKTKKTYFNWSDTNGITSFTINNSK